MVASGISSTVRAMFDGIGPEGDRVGNVRGITAVNGDRKPLGMGFLDDRPENIHVHAIKPIARVCPIPERP